MESMACGIPNIVPEHSAFAEWARGGVWYTDIADEPYTTPRGVNTIGAVPTQKSTIEALNMIYKDPTLRKALGETGRQLVAGMRDWKSIASMFDSVLRGEST